MSFYPARPGLDSNRGMASVKIDRRKLEALLGRAMKSTAEDYDGYFSDTIQSPVFGFRATTEEGLLEGSPRDIVASGDLLNSQSYEALNPLLFRFLWDVDYAVPVHEGYFTQGGTEVVGRPWTLFTLIEYPLEEVFAKNARRVFA